MGGVHHAAARGFAQTFGLHPAIGLLTIVVDWMLFGPEALSGFTSTLFLSIPVSAVLGFITYRAQRKWYGDDDESAKLKALGSLALLTAIPSPLPGFLYVPAGMVGFFRRKKN